MEHVSSSLVKHLWIRVGRDDIPGLAAQLAYFFLLSLFPLLIFIVTLLPYLSITQEYLLSYFRDFAPGGTMDLIETSLNDVMDKNGKLLSFGIIATLWSASNGIHAIVVAFNKAYDVKESRSFILERTIAVLLTFGMILVIVVALLLPVFGRHIGLFLFSELGLSNQFLAVWTALRWLISPIFLFIIFVCLVLDSPQ